MILVTGGTGLLGSHLLFELAKQNRSVRAIFRNPDKKRMVRKIFSYYADNPGQLFDKIQWREACLLDFGAMEEALDGISEIYHASAIVSFYPEDHQMIPRVNIDGTANLVNQALDRNIGKFCYVSSVATLGRAENQGECDEETYWVPSRRNSVYAESKYEAEREVWRAMAEGLNAVIVNPSVILGPGFWHGNSGLFRLVYEGLKYYTRGVNGYIDVRDVARAMMRLMDRNCFGERFIVSAGHLSYQQLFTWIAKYLDKPAPTINVPASLTQIVCRLEAIRSHLTHTKPEVTSEMAYATAQVYTYSNRKIREWLNFTFTPLEDSIREICEIYLAELDRAKG